MMAAMLEGVTIEQLRTLRAVAEAGSFSAAARKRALGIVVDALFPPESLVAFAKDFAAEHPDVSLALFTDLLSAVTAHVREKRSAWGIALEDADLDGLDHRPVADVRLIPVAAGGHALAKRQGSIEAPALAEAVQIVLGEHRHEAEHGADTKGVFSPRTWRVVDLATKRALI